MLVHESLRVGRPAIREVAVGGVNEIDVAGDGKAQAGQMRAIGKVNVVTVKAVECVGVKRQCVKNRSACRKEYAVERLDTSDERPRGAVDVEEQSALGVHVRDLPEDV